MREVGDRYPIPLYLPVHSVPSGRNGARSPFPSWPLFNSGRITGLSCHFLRRRQRLFATGPGAGLRFLGAEEWMEGDLRWPTDLVYVHFHPLF